MTSVGRPISGALWIAGGLLLAMGAGLLLGIGMALATLGLWALTSAVLIGRR